ncbi:MULTISPECIES: hypothetical protein [Streptomyces]|nr:MULTISPECIES: hypothetical protein [Streptomyces]MBT3077677.1 hypothetical protein [Streptomyces sp. COG21]MBT3084522.1 hypothetical protein [Streptomyces sp. COG20]MBT3085428.1 hypothetical protein [Streptomyces sp. CYG21]MBT3099022.1 hypothetical protein [Streptomyces sp. CBG30]MBT3103529.1 hypothetical protein [Streptomyces sp. COG19]
MTRRLLAAALRRLGLSYRARGGTLPPYQPRPDDVLVYLSPGEYRPPRRT